MRAANNWIDYELIDTSRGERLERWGDILLIRPDPQILWDTPRKDPRWKQAHARYHRSNTGGGQWERYRPIPDSWQIAYGDLQFALKPMGFKHTGLFPEQAVNWDMMADLPCQGAEPLWLHRRRHPGLRGRGCPRHPRGRLQGYGGLG